MIRAVLLSCCLFATSAQPLALLTPSHQVDDEPVAATPDGTLNRADFGLWLVDRAGVDNVYDYVVEILAEREATARGLMPTDEEIDRAFDTEYDLIVQEYYHGDPATYERDIGLRNQDPEKHAGRRRKELRAELIISALAKADREVTDEQIARRFKDLYGPLAERTSLDVLFFNMYGEMTPGERPNMGALKDAALVRAQAAVAALRNGESFASLQADTDPVNSDFITKEGRILTYSRRLLGKEVETAVASLDEPGDVTPPISVFDGYYVVQLAGRLPVDLDETREDVIRDIHESPANSGEIAVTRQRLLEMDGVEILLR